VSLDRLKPAWTGYGIRRGWTRRSGAVRLQRTALAFVVSYALCGERESHLICLGRADPAVDRECLTQRLDALRGLAAADTR
jgi:hypothetical protein